MDVRIESSWKQVLQEEFEKDYFKDLVSFIKNEYQTKKIYPPPKDIFQAFTLCPFDAVKVVILGQDPYHGPRQANGLCFSVHEGVRNPPSLQNIFQEIRDDCGLPMPKTGNLESWARQGVFLLNATLTVVAGNPASHQSKGWERFTDAVIKKISEEKEQCVFLLWGRFAQQKEVLIDRGKHLVLKAAHPSPYSAANGFFGCKHFSTTNEYLKENGKTPIDWTV